MPKANKRKIPEDFDKVKPTIEKLQLKLKEAQRKSIKTETKQTSLWPILELDHQISRYVTACTTRKSSFLENSTITFFDRST